MSQKNIAVIPARGGSKRVPRKNVLDFMGKPMIAWTIDAALKSNMFDHVLVSTDCEEIANTSREYGAEVPFLRVSNNDDITPVSQATIEAVSQAEDYWGEEFSQVVQLMPNCPLRSTASIINSLTHFYKNDSDYQISCFKLGWMNPWWAAKLKSNNNPSYLFPESLDKRSQDLENLYCPTGAIWIANTEKLKKNKTFYGEGHLFFPIDWRESVDIDDYDDLYFAQMLYLSLNGDLI